MLIHKRNWFEIGKGVGLGLGKGVELGLGRGGAWARKRLCCVFRH